MNEPALHLVEAKDMDKVKALEAALGQIERNFGKGSIMKLGQSASAAGAEVVSTGSLGLDIALGIGGLPRGRHFSVARCVTRIKSSSVVSAVILRVMPVRSWPKHTPGFTTRNRPKPESSDMYSRLNRSSCTSSSARSSTERSSA